MLFRAVVVLLLACVFQSCAADPAGTCTTLCTDAGFESGVASVEDDETSCVCSAGDLGSEITADACTAFCDGLGKSEAQAFRSGNAVSTPDACQCS